MTLVSVVVPNWNGAGILEACLLSLRAQTLAAHEVVVVDNGSTDGSHRIAEAAPGVRLLRQRDNLGFGGGANLGVAATEAPLVAVLNSDARPEPDWLSNLVRASGDAEQDVWAWGSVQLRPDGAIESAGDAWALAGAGYKLMAGDDVARLPAEPFEVFSPPGAAPLFRRSAFDVLGGYDEKFFLYYEDLELSWRARWRGWRALTVPDARVHHALGGSGDLGRTYRYAARNSLVTTVRHVPRLHPLTLAGHTLHEAAVARQRGVLRPYLRGRAAGVAALPRAFAERRRSAREHVRTRADVEGFLNSQGQALDARSSP